MKLALIGLPQVGKKTVFSLMTGFGYDHLVGRPTDYHVGAVKVADLRVDRLIALYNPKKSRHAEIECTLAPPPPHDPKPREQWLTKLKDMDALCHVVRGFEDPSVFHVDGAVDPLRDIEAMNLELTVSDLSLIETRLERIGHDQKRKFDADRAHEEELLRRLQPHLEGGRSLRCFPWHEGEEKRVRSLQFLTLKGLVVALNLGDDNFPNDALLGQARTRLAGWQAELAQLSAKLEMEVTQLESESDRAEFLQALGISEPAIHVLTRLLYKALGYISFFTVGEDEVRAWTIRQGGTAVDAAHAIHSDLARGFIRAEVIKYADLMEAADAGRTGHQAEVMLKETGKLHLKGKDYVVEDGDIVHIRHSG
jgi:GTP-binding protein YchF